MATRILTFACLVAVCSTFMHCGGSDPKPVKTEKERVTEILMASGGTWSPEAQAVGVTVDGVDVTEDLFEGFGIKFNETTFTTTGTTPVWLRTDTWAFTDETATAFVRGQDGKTVTISKISETQVTLTLAWDQTTYEGGRARSIPGTYVFVLNK